jgi:two-component system, OmpR family, heavy metal sensor histidine kinase CusS
MRSLRGRLLAETSLASVLVLGLLGLAIYAAMRQALLSDFNASLNTQARMLAGMLDQDGRDVTFEFDPQQMPDFLSPSRQCYFELWRSDGRVLARSPSLGKADLPRSAASLGTVGEVELPSGLRGKAITLVLTPDQQEQEDAGPAISPSPVTITVAGEPLAAQRTLRLLAGMLILLCAAAIVAMGAALTRVVRRGMRPVRKIAEDIESLRETDLDRRLSVESAPSELAPMLQRINGFLGRLEAAFAREKSFTADVAHELRTPLTGLRLTLEVCRSRPRDAAAYETAIDECRLITDRMEAMVQSLLLLARTEAGQVRIKPTEIDLAQMVSDCWRLYQGRADSRGVNVDLDVTQPCPARADPEKLRIVVQNLMDNAVSYVNQGGRIQISVRSLNDRATMEIANTGSLVAAKNASLSFERFWRGDAARSDAGGHCGLGLSLSRRLARALGGEISLKTAEGGEFIVRLELCR